MKIAETNLGPTVNASVAGAIITCSKCGREMSSFCDWVRGDDGLVFCEFCYKSFLFPNVDRSYLELFD